MALAARSPPPMAASARLGPTVSLNPGSDYNTGILKGVIVRLRGSDVEDVQFVAA